jgi:3-oxoacyl-[acyl-carrier protein] reductase
MDLKIKDRYFIVGGAGSGFGKAIAKSLAEEGAKVLAVTRTGSKLTEMQNEFPENIQVLEGDITTGKIQDEILAWAKGKKLSGALINAGGPPAGGFFEIGLNQWEEAWRVVVKWKIELTQKLIPLFLEENYGRLVFIESISVKQPVQNLILSNALRPAIVGFAKTLSQEVAGKGITVNVLAPGMHATPALERLFVKKSELEKITYEEAKLSFENDIPVGKMANADEMASLALWLLSPLSRYVTGQTITHDGGAVKGIFG